VACVDLHLISGCDIIIDVDLKSLEHLECVQKAALRRILDLSKWSLVIALFTELGLLPIRYQHLILALRYLKYLIKLSDDRWAKLALKASFNL
ncbi:hypothetical protein C8J56DRAFT_732504, partial [Mycena floridula]